MIRPTTSRRSAHVPRVAAGLALAMTLASLTGCSLLPFGSSSRGVPVPADAGAKPGKARAKGTTASPAAATAAAPVQDPREPFWPYERATRLVAADSPAAAEAELQRALALDPTYTPALALLSKLYFASGRHREAVTMLEPVRLQPDAYPSEARLTLLAGLALHEDALGRTDRARVALAPVLEAGARAAGSAGVYVTLRGESPDSAESLARAAARRDGRSAANQNNLGITRLRSGDLDAARRAFESAIERDPSLPGPYYNLALMEKFWRFDDEAATRWFAEYWKRSHDDPDGLYAVFAPRLAAGAPAEGARP